VASREIKDLSPVMQVLYNKAADKWRRDPWLVRNGIAVLLICTHRDDEEQARLYAQGRTTPGKIVTRAKPGKSKHNATLPGTKTPAAEAFDVVPLRHGKAIWGTGGDGIDDDPTDDHKDDLEVWQRVGELGKSVGLEWYGDPEASFREFPHFENPEA
jgi:peptidoglycan L-alanyl-D-glutamate endopeptidase CwlK